MLKLFIIKYKTLKKSPNKFALKAAFEWLKEIRLSEPKQDENRDENLDENRDEYWDENRDENRDGNRDENRDEIPMQKQNLNR